jgi:hypothetical protein
MKRLYDNLSAACGITAWTEWLTFVPLALLYVCWGLLAVLADEVRYRLRRVRA